MNKGKTSDKPELERKSLSDSDLQARWDNYNKVAKKALALGKDLGIEIKVKSRRVKVKPPNHGENKILPKEINGRCTS
ncbi:hypothetical protein V6N13_097520 [Hibiscus sabdariffa]